MIRGPLPSEVLARYRSDKDSGPPQGHSYGKRFYDHFLTRYRWSSAVLEVGIAQGESLKAWADFFPDAQIVGIDCDRSRLVNDGRIKSFCIDASDERQLSLFAQEYADTFSVVIDDGSHRIQDQLLAVRVLKRCLKPGGLLVVEDVVSDAHNHQFAELGCRVESWDTHLRRDNRIAYFLKV
jgi:cephalosporin hydroxylase